MTSRDEQLRNPQSDLESPFLDEELFVRETEADWEAHLAALEAESPFQHAFEQSRAIHIEPENMREEFVEEQVRAEADEFGVFADHESWDMAATLEFEAAGCTGDHELLEFEGELLDSEIWQGTADQDAFRDRVLNAHIALSRKRLGEAKRDLSLGDLDVVAGTDNIKMGSEAAAAAGRLLASANADLGKAQAAGHADALRTIRLSATSGYRSSTHQKNLWLRYFTAKGGYYDQTQTARERLADGPHSEQAITYMLTPQKKSGFGLGGRIAAPGYSNHQGGIAIDFWQVRKKGHKILNNSGEKARAKWRSTWFHEWLRGNAKIFGFQPISTEEWHWEYRHGSGTTASASAATSTGPSIVTSTTLPAGSTAQPAAPTDYLGGRLAEITATSSIRVAVFSPKAASTSSEVDVLVYVHGLFSPCPPVPKRPADLISKAPFGLGKIVDASNRKIILAVPFLEWKRKQPHPLGDPAKLNRFVDEVLKEVGRMRGTSAPSLRDLILAGHSRAYGFFDPLAKAHASSEMTRGALSRLTQVWAFDTAYTSPIGDYRAWFSSNPKLVFHVFYRKWSWKNGMRVASGTKAGGEKYDQLALELAKSKRAPGRFNVKTVSESHCSVPVKRLPDLLAASVSDSEQEAFEDFDEQESKEKQFEDNAELFYEDIEHELAEEIEHLDYETEDDETFLGLAEERYEVDRFGPSDELEADEQHLSAEPESNVLTFEALDSDDEHVSDSEDEEFEFEDEDYADHVLEEETSDKSPLPVPVGNPVPFAPLPPMGSYWPVRTSREDARVVSYMYQAPSGIVGRAGRMFLAGRKGKRKGKQALRWHAGVDLFANIKDVVVACEEGKIVDFSFFYTAKSGQRTYKLLIQHDGSGVVVNYGEVTGDSLSKNGLQVGMRVAAGQPIGFVSDTSMLHLETYIKGTTASHQWWKDEKTPPRQLLNPTRYLLLLRDHGLSSTQDVGTQSPPTRPASTSKKPPAELVRFAQRALNAVEGERLKYDGDLGRLTRIALERFRRKYNLGADGVLDNKTQIALAQRALEEIRQQSLFPQFGVLDMATRDALVKFKSESGLGFNATLDVATRAALSDDLARRSSAPIGPLDRIIQVAAESEIARYKWRDRGVAPPGYIKGMALVYARVYCKLKAGDAAAKEMAKANTGNMNIDALAHYTQEFNAAGMGNDSAGVNTLRHLFVLLIGLGLRESSGRYCEGRDKSASNTTAETAEAGLFQTSYNARSASPLMPQLFLHYLANPSGFVDIFNEGVSCRDSDFENFGAGDGREFQRLSKSCPAFAAEFTAVGLRNRRKHWGPINRKAAEIRPECDAMLMQVQNAVDKFKLCPVLQ